MFGIGKPKTCNRPPEGWVCNLPRGHSGPCPAYPIEGSTTDQPRVYGFGGTIHSDTSLDVEVRDGVVVAVWFRCQPLPFRQANVGPERAAEMQRMMQAAPVGVQAVVLTPGD